MQLIEKVVHTIHRYSMWSRGEVILVGLSGGPDSVCLLTVLNHLRPDFDGGIHALYVDHGLRPEETPEEIAFCQDLCGALRVPFNVRHLGALSFPGSEGLTKQEAARELRYRIFEEVAAEVGADRVALGHHADDQAETVLMRLFRGSGPSGLAGIPPVRNYVIRPLIELERKEIEEYLEQEGIGFMVDSSNLRGDYMRNKIRHLIIPTVTRIDRNIIKTICRTADIFRDEERYFQLLVTKTLMKLISRKTDRMLDLFLSPLESMDTVLLRRLLRRAIDETKGLRGITFAHIEEIITLIKAGKSGDRIYLPGEIRVIKRYSTITLSSELPPKVAPLTVEGPGTIGIKESAIMMVLSRLPAAEIEGYGDGKELAFLNADALHFPLTVRSRRPGDYFYPLGLGNRKKLQDFFVDEKIPRDERDAVPLLVSGDDIIWIVGHRIDDRYRVDKSTTSVLKCEIKPFRY